VGIELVRLALMYHAASISGRAFKVLAYMASTALDRPNDKGQPVRLYFAGWEPLARVIGQDPDGNPRAAYEQVRRTLRELERAGVIERLVSHPHTGRAQTFRLHVGPSFGVAAATKTEGQSPPEQRGSHHRDGGADATETEGPRTHTGTSKDLSEDSTPSPPSASTDRARDRGAA
jgi:hypothetical protein